MAGRRAPGALESEVLATLWSADVPLSAAAVQARLRGAGHELAYKTVLTVLTRLYEKGAVDRSVQGRAHLYRPARDQAEALADEMSRAFARGRDRTAVLERFVHALDPADEVALRDMLGERRVSGG